MKQLVFLFLMLLSTLTFGQSVLCITEENTKWKEECQNLLRNPGDITTVEVLRINIHYTLKTNGTGNFTETGDNQGNSLTGYQFAKDVVNLMNQYQLSNVQMTLPPNNTTPNPSKNYYYVLEAIYFHRDNNYHVFSNSGYSVWNLREHSDSVVNVFYSGSPVGNNANNNDKVGGYVLSSSLNHNSKVKYTEIGSVYTRYVNYLNRVASGQTDNYSWVLDAVARTTEHEIGHLLGMSHTVSFGNGTPCPNSSTSICGDGCGDTPSVYEMMNTFNSPTHPHCGWINTPPWCSNNMMDYGNASAMTTCQLEIVHTALEGGMLSYNQCAAMYDDLNICNLGFPYIAYNGQNVTIGQCTSGALLSGEEEMTIHFFESVDISNFDVQDGAEFEAIFIAKCN